MKNVKKLTSHSVYGLRRGWDAKENNVNKVFFLRDRMTAVCLNNLKRFIQSVKRSFYFQSKGLLSFFYFQLKGKV